MANFVQFNPLRPDLASEAIQLQNELINTIRYVQNLPSTTPGTSGSETIGSAPIGGVAGDTVYEQLVSITNGSPANLMREINTTFDIDGNLLTVTEKGVGGSILTTTTLSYNLDGTVNTITEDAFGKIFISTLHYINGDLDPSIPLTRVAV